MVRAASRELFAEREANRPPTCVEVPSGAQRAAPINDREPPACVVSSRAPGGSGSGVRAQHVARVTQGDRDEFTTKSTLTDWAMSKAKEGGAVAECRIYPGVSHFEIEVRAGRRDARFLCRAVA